jgi:hypothetical protein
MKLSTEELIVHHTATLAALRKLNVLESARSQVEIRSRKTYRVKVMGVADNIEVNIPKRTILTALRSEITALKSACFTEK